MIANVMPGVAAVKRGEMSVAAALLRPVVRELTARGVAGGTRAATAAVRKAA